MDERDAERDAFIRSVANDLESLPTIEEKDRKTKAGPARYRILIFAENVRVFGRMPAIVSTFRVSW